MDKRQGGANARPLDDTIAGTGPGIPDDALAPGEAALPDPPSDADVARIAEKLGATPAADRDRDDSASDAIDSGS